jgi:BRCA1-associated RING domain protein 1
MPGYRANLEDLIAAAGGSVLEKAELSSTSLILYSMEAPPSHNNLDALETINKRLAEAQELATTAGCRAIPHTWLLDCIASCAVELNVSCSTP